MNNFLWFCLTLAAAAAVGLLFYRLKVPAGAMVGALIGAGALQILTGCAVMPASVKILTKTVAGLFVGMSMTAEMVSRMKTLFKPVVTLVCLIFSLCLGTGVLLWHVTELDAVTALFCVAPGGLTDMTLMTMDMGGDAAVVAVLQILRLMSVYCISMPLAKLMGRKRKDGLQKSSVQTIEQKERSSAEKKQGILLAAAVAAVGGAAGWVLSWLVDFSVLILIGSMAACAAVNIRTGRLYMPKAVRRATQILSGALIGISVTAESLSRLRSVLLPALFVCCGFVLINLVLAFVLHRVCRLDLATAVLSSSAGGATEAALTAPDLDADPSVVSVLQIGRLVCTTSFYPLLVQLVYQLL